MGNAAKSAKVLHKVGPSEQPQMTLSNVKYAQLTARARASKYVRSARRLFGGDPAAAARCSAWAKI